MDIRQLRPEQKKLWRRIYLQEKERGSSAEIAAREADAVVTHWEARGAFDEPLVHDAAAWTIVAETLHAKFPDAFAAIHQALVDEETKRRTRLQISTVDKAATPTLSDTERLHAIRRSLESDTVTIAVDGLPAGLVTRWEVHESPDRPVRKLVMTVEGFFPLP
jgi:TPP-dependent trihydroxycyclohexane-1,2-dione (THcHDO) dehydratase